MSLLNMENVAMISSETVAQIALRLKHATTWMWDERADFPMTHFDYIFVVERVAALGVTNFFAKNDEFDFYKDKNGVTVTRGYGATFMWAAAFHPHTPHYIVLSEKEKEARGLDVLCTAVDCCLVQDDRKLDELIQYHQDWARGQEKPPPPLEILEQARRYAFEYLGYSTGIVESYEIRYNDGNLNRKATPKGWVPGVERAKKRARRTAIHDLWGKPPANQMRELGVQRYQIEDQNHAAALLLEEGEVARLPVEAQERYLKQSGYNSRYSKMLSQMSEEERELSIGADKQLMRGDDYNKVDPIDDEDPFPRQEGDEEARVIEIVPEDNGTEPPPEINLNEFREVMHECGYADPSIDQLAVMLAGKESILGLSSMEMWNIAQYARRAMLVKTTLELEGDRKPDPAQRSMQVPEIRALDQKIRPRQLSSEDPEKMTIKRFLKELTIDAIRTNTYLPDVDLANLDFDWAIVFPNDDEREPEPAAEVSG